MPGLNLVQLIGYLGRDPEGRFIPSGTKVCNFSLAVTRRWTGSVGEPKEATDWFNVDAWARSARSTSPRVAWFIFLVACRLTATSTRARPGFSQRS